MYVNFKSIPLPKKIDVSGKEVVQSNNNINGSSPLNTTSTPFSPVTPSPINTTIRTKLEHKNQTHETTACNITPFKLEEQYTLKGAFNYKGYMPIKRYSKTLQGSIWKVTAINKQEYIIKVANKYLHNKRIAYVKGHTYNCHEDIVKEMQILKYLKSKNPPAALITYIDKFSDQYNFFLVLEDGGTVLFDFVKECHQYIRKHIIDMNEWHLFCQTAMKQMVEVIDWMHTYQFTCHLDISLENFTIKNMETGIIMNGTNKKIIFARNFQIKLIDFGLAEVFRTKNNETVDFRCNKYVGKTGYKSPEVYSKTCIFDARSADCWSLAVCFFMLFFGCQPFTRPSMDDNCFKLIMRGKLIDILDSWNLLGNVTAQILDLLIRLFRTEKYRLNITQIKQHSFFDQHF